MKMRQMREQKTRWLHDCNSTRRGCRFATRLRCTEMLLLCPGCQLHCKCATATAIAGSCHGLLWTAVKLLRVSELLT
jgi:hypothetical protein